MSAETWHQVQPVLWLKSTQILKFEIWQQKFLLWQIFGGCENESLLSKMASAEVNSCESAIERYEDTIEKEENHIEGKK